MKIRRGGHDTRFPPRLRSSLPIALAAVAAASMTPTLANGGRMTGGVSPMPATKARQTAVQGRTIEQAKRIQAETTARYGWSGAASLLVTEASSTAVIESFTLLMPGLEETRVVPAANGIYFAICPRRASCPYPPPRFARPPSDFLARRASLELAIRTFAETSADVVAVSLPTRRFTLFIAERDELGRATDAPIAGEALRADPSRPPDAALRTLVAELTRSRIFVPIALEPTPAGRDTLTAMPLRPSTAAHLRRSAEKQLRAADS